MRQKTIILLILTLSLISLLSFNVFSITEDFIALAQDSSVKACKCAIAENTVKIGNTGNINSLYSITQEGKAAEWSVIRPKSFSLEEKKIKTLINPINVPCDAKPGEYDLFTYIETGFGLKKVISQKVIVEECNAAEEKEETPKANVTETVKANETIKPNTAAKVNETAKPEEIKETEKPKLEPKDELDNIEITVPEVKDICGCNKTIAYMIVAKSKAPDTIKTTVEGPAFASLGWNSPKDMGSDDEFSFDLNLNIGCEEEPGKKTIKLTTESLNTSKKEENIIEFELKKEGECGKASPALIKVLKWITYIVAAFVVLVIIAIIILYRSESDEEPGLEDDIKKVKSKKAKTAKRTSKKKTARKKRK